MATENSKRLYHQLGLPNCEKFSMLHASSLPSRPFSTRVSMKGAVKSFLTTENCVIPKTACQRRKGRPVANIYEKDRRAIVVLAAPASAIFDLKSVKLFSEPLIEKKTEI